MPRYKGNERQDLMIPVSLREQLLPGTIEHAIDWIIDHQIDTTRFDRFYRNDESGRPAYDPKALLKVILFGYSKGLISSRQIEQACRTNIVFMALCGDLHPDHATIARFLTAHLKGIRELFRDVLLIAAQGDLIGAELFALDGCKIPSNAAKEHSGTHAELRRKVEKLETRLRAMIEQHRGHDEKDSHHEDHQPPDPSGAAERYQAQIDRIQDFLADHEPRIGALGKEVKSNITDNESAKLKSGSGYVQGYNALALVDAKHQIIVHAEPIGQINEAPLLPRMVRRSIFTLRKAGLDRANTATVIADTNYFTNENARFLLTSTLDGYIPDNQFRNRDRRFADRSRARRASHRRFTRADFLYDKLTDSYSCPADKQLVHHTRTSVSGRPGKSYRAAATDCAACHLASRCLSSRGVRRHLFVSQEAAATHGQKMREKIDSPAARRIYSQRMGIVEPVFANIAANKRMSRFTLRGRAKVRIQWLLFTLVHNIEKIATTGLIHSLAVP
jgi:transposase